MKRILSIFLVLLILVNSLSISIFASEITTAGGNNDVPVELTQSVANFSVTVPTVLPVDLDANGVVTVATDNKIINNSWGSVEVKGVSLTPLNDWELVDFTTDFKNKKVGLKEFGFEVNDIYVLTDGSCEATFDVISGNSYINFSYDANVATQKQSLEDQQIAYVIFTIGWASSNFNSIPVTSIDSEGNNLNATSTNIVGSQKDELLASLESSGLADSSEVDYLINVESDNFDGMADTTFDMAGIANEGDTVILLHYDESLNKWEYVSTETVNSDGKVTADFSSYSPIAFIINGKVTMLDDGVSGLYDSNGVRLCSWRESGIDIFKNYKSYFDEPENPDNWKLSPTSGYNILKNYPTVTKVIIPDYVVNLGSHCFYNCVQLKTVIMGDNLKAIGDGAFANCDGLSTVIVGCNVESIGKAAFGDCQGLKYIDLGNSVTYIGAKCFVSCYYIETVIIPDSLKQIDSCAFEWVGYYTPTTYYYKGTKEQWNNISKHADAFASGHIAGTVYNYR